MQVGPREQKHVAEYAAQAPDVLILQVTSVRMPQHLQCDQVFAGNHGCADVELGGQPRVFAVADASSVDPDFQARARRAHMQINPLLRPVFRNLHPASIGADRIAVREKRPIRWRIAHDARRIHLERINVIHVQRFAIAKQFHAARHRNALPVAIVKRQGFKFDRTFFRMIDPEKFPVAADALQPRRIFDGAWCRGGGSGVGMRPGHGARRHPVDLKYERVFPRIGGNDGRIG